MESKPRLTLNGLGYFETRGLDVLVFSNCYEGLFNDAKTSGIELIHHGTRTVTNGDVRLSPTPAQWEPVPAMIERRVDAAAGEIEARLSYPDFGFAYAIKAKAVGEGVSISVHLDAPLPAALEGKAGFNLEFLPSAYFKKGYLADGRGGAIPRYPTGPMAARAGSAAEPLPFAAGKKIVMAPEDPERRVSVEAIDGELSLYDGRNQAQNGWFVLRSLLPSGKAGKVLEWFLSASATPGWLRLPVIAHSQVGYHPAQEKRAIIELDKRDAPLKEARLLRIMEDGSSVEALRGLAKPWGPYLRYEYLIFDFSAAKEEGLYALEYGKVRTAPFKISRDVFGQAWQPTSDIFFPVQMDHMAVREAYRVWHGAPHLGDALQAPVNHEHFDLYAQGPSTDTAYAPGQRIPGLDIGGWFDAGDFDIRTQTVYGCVLDLVMAREAFGIDRDQTAVDQGSRSVRIHEPDGVPDILQQIEHGTLALIAQFRAVGHAIPGIVENRLEQYTHLGDAASKTDDRWAFTSESSALNYGSMAALAAASRALRGYRDALAEECLSTALGAWDKEAARAPVVFAHGNTTGGDPLHEELRAAVELLLCTGEARFAQRIEKLWPAVEAAFPPCAVAAALALPRMGKEYAERVRKAVLAMRERFRGAEAENPFGVLITRGGWAGNGAVLRIAVANYVLHKAFPDLVDEESVFKGLHYLLGCHPGSDISFVSGVGAVSKEVAYGSNRADFSFIAGGIVPGMLILKPDFPENKEDWPFFWGENEYVISEGAPYIFLVHAAMDLLKGR